MDKIAGTTLLNRILMYGLLSTLLACQSTPDKDIPAATKSVKDSLSPGRSLNSKMLREEVLVEYVKNSPQIQPGHNNGVPFASLDYDKVIAYDFDGSGKSYPNVIENSGKFVPVILAQQALTQMQADRILSTLAKKTSYGGGTSACFEPHFALVFFKNDQRINQLSVCLGCNYLVSDLEIPAMTHKVINKGKDNEYPLIGFSKAGKSAIVNLCKELSFSYGDPGDAE